VPPREISCCVGLNSWCRFSDPETALQHGDVAILGVAILTSAVPDIPILSLAIILGIDKS